MEIAVSSFSRKSYKKEKINLPACQISNFHNSYESLNEKLVQEVLRKNCVNFQANENKQPKKKKKKTWNKKLT